MRKILTCAFVLLLGTLCACPAPTSAIQYQAEQAAFESIGLEWWEYVREDETLGLDDVRMRWQNLAAWRQRLAATAQALGLPEPAAPEVDR